MRADLVIPAWFFVPWLIFAAKVIRVSMYERQFGLLKDLSPFAFTELMRRINEQRKADPVYDRMKGDTWKWLKITAAWWVVSFIALLGGALLYGTFKS